MTTKIGSALCALALAVPGWMLFQVAGAATPPPVNKVLVLDNEQILEGDIDLQGAQYRVRRSVGEVWMPADHVLRLCNSREEAYAYLRSRANLLDPDEHLRLARWCHMHALRQQALDEVTAAVRLRPDHSDSQRLLRSLQRAAAKPAATPAVQVQAHEEPESNQTSPEVDTESLSLFITKVQPILMNACASCHASGHSGTFKLARTYEAGAATRRTTQQNLTAVLGEINKAHPQGNMLLIKSISVHGSMAQPALKGKEAPAYKTLEEWVKVTSPQSLQIHEGTAIASAGLPVGDHLQTLEHRSSKSDATSNETTGALLQASTNKPVNTSAQPSTTRSEGSDVAASATPAEPADPYDPAIFNRAVNPQKVDRAKR